MNRGILVDKLILQAQDLFKGCSFTYYICGGFALELFVGKKLRPHSDLDASVFMENKKDVAAFLHEKGWDIYKRIFEPQGLGGVSPIADTNDPRLNDARILWAMKEGSQFSIKPREHDEKVFDFEILSHAQVDFNFIEIVLDNKAGDDFVLNKNTDVTRKLNKAILYNDCGIPYMSPELVMFLKSPQIYTTHQIHAAKTPTDFKAIMPLLPDESKKWLMDALNTTYPDGYDWLNGLI